MDDLQKTLDILVKAFEELIIKIKEVEKAFSSWISKKDCCSSDQYGMSLEKIRKETFVKRYSYRPIARKHLPYQRRSY